MTFFHIASLGALFCSAALAAAPSRPVLVNAALPANGARVEVAAGPGARKDSRTEAEATFDGNLHSRQVVSGAPYTFTIELLDRLPIEKISFADSDYESELAPKEVEVVLDDGTLLRRSLELKRPEKRKPAWQELEVGKTAQTIKVTVLSNHQPSDKVNWGGFGEIAVWTSANLEEKLRVPDHDAHAPSFAHIPPIQPADGKVQLPPVAKPGEHPCLLLTPGELAELRAALPRSERGQAALKSLLDLANGCLAAPDFPDPKGPPAQLKSRGDAVAKQHDRLALNCGSLGIAYALTREKKYAVAAGAILVGYAQRYDSYAEHKGANKADTGKVMAQRLSEAMWLIPLIEAYDYIYESGVLSAAEKQQIENQLLRPAITFIRRKEPAAEVAARDKANPDWRTAPKGKAASNWLIFYNAATIMTGALTGDRNMIDLAAADFRELILNGVGADGMWGEGAIGYQFFALSAMVTGLETAAHQGIDLWSFENRRLKMLFDSPLRYAYPDGSAPGINDSGRARFGDWSTMSYDYAWLRYQDPAYAFLVNASPRQLHFSQAVYFPTRVFEKLPEPAATSYPSTVFQNLGYAILRNPGTYALLDYGPHGGVHGHLDKLNLILFGDRGGKGDGTTPQSDELGGEPKFHRYEDALHDQWTRQTVAHNSMSVDQRSQQPTTGKLLVFEDTPELKVIRAESAGSYAGVVLDRTILVVSGLVLDLYHGRSLRPHTWDRTFRFQGAMTGFPGAGATQPFATRDGYQHLQVAVRQPASEMWRGAWQTKVGALNVLLAGAPGQEIVLATGPDSEQLALARQQGRHGDFAAAYALEGWTNAPRALRLITNSTAVTACECAREDGTLVRLMVAHGTNAWEAQGWRSDARVLCAVERDNDVRVLLGGGTFAENGAASVRLAKAGNAFAAGSRARLSAQSQWSPDPVSAVESSRKRARGQAR